MASVDNDLLPPRYRDPIWITSGGMSDLFRAVDELLDRPVAIKLLPERFASDQEFRRRFRREALAAARLSGEPNTVTIFDVGEWRGRPFMVMEYLPGGTLQQALRAGIPRQETALEWLQQAARSLDAAHGHGVVHRDVKPANLLFDGQGHVHVGDFGIATAAGLESVTVTGAVLGTAGYLAPEQALGRPATPATDCYALGVVAYELLTGARPYRRDSMPSEAAAHAYAPVPSASHRNPSLPAAIDSVFETALAKSPIARFQSCTALVIALRRACTEPTEPATRRLGPVAAPEPETRVVEHRAAEPHLAGKQVAAPRVAEAQVAGAQVAGAQLGGRGARRRPPKIAVGAGVMLLSLAGAAGAFLATQGRSPHASAAASTRAGTARAVTKVKTAARSTTPRVTQPTSLTAAGYSDLNTRGYRLMLAGRYSAALPLLQDAVVGLVDPSDPVTAYANFNLGQTLVRLGRCADALPYLQRAAQLESTSREAQAALVYAQSCAGTAPPTPVATGEPPGRGHGGPSHGHGNPHD